MARKNKNLIIFVVTLLLVIGSFSSHAKEIDDDNLMRQGIGSDGKIRNLYSITELKKEKITFGTYHVEGYVAKVYTCPACPKDALCKPCMRDLVILSTEKEALESYDIKENQLVIFVKDAKEYKLGKKYRFLIKVSNVSTVDQNFNNVEAVYSEKLRR